jgi:phage tail-like protein
VSRAVVDDLPSTRPIASYLPAMLQADDFCVRFTRGLDPVLAPVLSAIDNLDAYLDPWLTPPDFLDWLAGWFGLELDATWPEERRRALVANALELGRWRGTVIGLALLVELYTGAQAEIDDGGAVGASDDPDEPLPGRRTQTVTVRYQPGDAVDVARLERLVRDAVPAHLAVRFEARTTRR